MTKDEYDKLRPVVDRFQLLTELKHAHSECCIRLTGHDEPMQIAFVGNSGKVDIPPAMQEPLKKFLLEQFQALISAADAKQESLSVV